MKFRPHLAVKIVESIERAWSSGERQVAKRAQLIVHALAEAGLLENAEVRVHSVYDTAGEFVVNEVFVGVAGSFED